MDIEVKFCPRCKLKLPLSDFTKNKNKKDGLDYECRKCKSFRFRSWRESDVERSRERSRSWHEVNRARSIQNSRDWRKLNPEKHRNATRNWAINNEDAVREIKRMDYARRPDAYKLAARKRKASLKSAIVVPFGANDLMKRMSMFGFVCIYCGGKFEHVDHAIPLSRGGLHTLSNLRPSCAKCNLRKGTKTISEFMASAA